MIKLYNNDCLIEMKNIPDKSIDMILCDLPYGTTACKWDVIIPFEPLWKEYKRIIKDRGCIALFGSEPFSSHLRMSNIKDYKYDWIWEKDRGTNFLQYKTSPLKIHEIISIFSKEVHLYNPQKEIPKSKNSISRAKRHLGSTKILQGGKIITGKLKGDISEYKNPESIIFFKRDIGNNQFKKENVFHPTQKPVTLLEYLIKTYTLENETILDNTMGSGNTGVACVNTNRNFIGIEKDETYFSIARKRIEEAVENKKGLLF